MLPIGPGSARCPAWCRRRSRPRTPRLKRARRETLLRVMQPFTGIPEVRRAASRKAIRSTPTRRSRARTRSRCWPTTRVGSSLNDRSYTGRHLPPAEPTAPLPPAEKVVALFARREGRRDPVGGHDSHVLVLRPVVHRQFPAHRSDDWRKNTRIMASTCARSTGSPRSARPCCGNRRWSGRGRLRSQIIDGQEYPEFLFAHVDDDGTTTMRPEFVGLHDQVALNRVLASASVEQRRLTFAVGLEHGNSTIGHTMLNVRLRPRTQPHRRHHRPRASGLGRHARVRDDPQHHDRRLPQAGDRGVHQAHRAQRLPGRAGPLRRRRRRSGTGRTG